MSIVPRAGFTSDNGVSFQIHSRMCIIGGIPMAALQTFKNTQKTIGHHATMWVPHRCELPLCSAGDHAALSRCGKCHIVLYCCREHQVADWARHKVECAHIASLNLTPRVYKVSEEREAHPLGLRPTLAEPPAGTAPSCGICGRTE